MTLTKREIRDIKALATARGRRDQRQFLAEGVRLLEVAEARDIRPEAVYAVREQLSPRGVELADAFRRRVPVIDVPPHVMEALADARTPPGLLAKFPLPEPVDLERDDTPRVLLCEGVSDPGNLGTLIRSAAAFGFGTVVAAGPAADPHGPKVVRSTAGAIFDVRVARANADLPDLLAFWKDDPDTCLVATARHGDPDPAELPRHRRLVLAVGSEHAGLSSNVVDAADLAWRIDHQPGVESLNAGVAGSLVMHQLYRRAQAGRSHSEP